MKVFAFDPTTGKKGDYLMDSFSPHFLSNMDRVSCTLPKWPDSDWMVATKMTDRNNKEIKFDRPVCFCMGQWTAGTDTAWQWVAYIPNVA